MEFRTVMAVLLTVVYLCGFGVIVITRFNELIGLPMNELGDFLAGAFGPLALAWLVFGYFQQGDELRQGTEALRMQATELNASVQQQIQLVEAQKLALENHERSIEPIIYIEYRGGSNIDGHDFDTFLISNKGEYCDQVNVEYVRPTSDVFDLDLEPLHKGSERKFSLEAFYNYRTEVAVNYRKTSGKEGVQYFDFIKEHVAGEDFLTIRKR